MRQENKRRPQVLLRPYQNANRWGNRYEDYIYLGKTGNGRLNLLAIKYFQGQKQLLDAMAGIRKKGPLFFQGKGATVHAAPPGIHFLNLLAPTRTVAQTK